MQSKNTQLNPLPQVNPPIYKPIIDSFTLSIPYNQCYEICPTLTQEYNRAYNIKLDENGQVSSFDIDPEMQTARNKGQTIDAITSRVYITENKDKGGAHTKFITCTITAKMLKHQYWDGITYDNFPKIYDYIMSLNKFQCTYETFLRSKTRDQDVCLNVFANLNTFLSMGKSLQEQSKHPNLFHFTNKFKSYNVGMQIGERNRCSPSKPFLKLYFKDYEMRSKSAEFKALYTPNVNTTDLCRLETTISNLKHKEYLILHQVLPMWHTAEDFLNISDEDLMKFLRFSTSSHLANTITRNTYDGLKGKDEAIFLLIQLQIQNRMSLDEILLSTVDRINTNGINKQTIKTRKQRMRKLIKKLYDLAIDTDAKLEQLASQNQHAFDIIKFITQKD